MKTFFAIAALVCLSFSYSTAQDTIEIGPNQSMCIAGKGPGQDGAINPYLGEVSKALVNNLGSNSFYVRIQVKDEIIRYVEVEAESKKDVVLQKDEVMYFDSELRTKVEVSFSKYEGE